LQLFFLSSSHQLEPLEDGGKPEKPNFQQCPRDALKEVPNQKETVVDRMFYRPNMNHIARYLIGAYTEVLNEHRKESENSEKKAAPNQDASTSK
jgi:hypothetical protein